MSTDAALLMESRVFKCWPIVCNKATDTVRYYCRVTKQHEQRFTDIKILYIAFSPKEDVTVEASFDFKLDNAVGSPSKMIPEMDGSGNSAANKKEAKSFLRKLIAICKICSIRLANA